MQKTTATWNVGDPVTSAHLNQITTDLTTLFNELSNEDLTLTYDIQGRLTQVVDNENTITINIDWSMFDSPTTPALYVQKAGDPKKWTITYNTAGYISTIVYAL